MDIKPRRRVRAIDILQNDFEYCTISYFIRDDNNELGEPIGTLVQRDSNVKCCIDNFSGNWSLVKGYEMSLQGYIEETTNYMVVNVGQVIEKGDIVTDYNGTKYEVLAVKNWYTHKDVFLRKMN